MSVQDAHAITKVIVLGFDGLEPTIVERMSAAGELPEMTRLGHERNYARLATTCPAQTPVAWSTFATGLNPGGHGIFDFLRRDPTTYLPEIGLNRFEQKNSFLPPKLVNLRDGQTIWDLLGKAGLHSTVIRCPCSYPPAQVKGRLLAGMGVPDLRGSFGVSSYYTTRKDARQGESESLIRIPTVAHGSVTTKILGPLHPKTRQPVETELELQVSSARQQVLLRVPGADGAVTVSPGAWSDWLQVRFKVGFLQTTVGMVRFYLARLEPDLELYASPVNFDPRSAAYPLSSPEAYSSDLAQAIGPYHTAGMVEDHTGLTNGRIDEEAFLTQCDAAWQEREAMLFHELDRFQEGLLYCLFDTPDRVQHMFWRFEEPDHPANRAGLDRAFVGTIDEQYRKCDRTLSKVMPYVDDQTLLVVLSDHGFGSFRRGVHLNAWLHAQGLLQLKDGLSPGPHAGDYLRQVDWTGTKAYALGLGGIYLNLAGREREGLVQPDEAEDLSDQIARELSGLEDRAHGTRAVTRVMPRNKVYSGRHAAESPDLVVNFNRTYRASWETAVGAVPEALFCDNQNRWSGDHVIDPELVPGVLLMNRPLRTERPEMQDLAPTVLEALGLPKSPQMEGASLL